MYSVLLSRDLFTPGQVAALCSVSRQCVAQWITFGRLETVTLTARAVRITQISLDGWMNKWRK